MDNDKQNILKFSRLIHRMQMLRNVINDVDNQNMKFEIVKLILNEIQLHNSAVRSNNGESLISLLKLFGTLLNKWSIVENIYRMNQVIGFSFDKTLQNLLINSTIDLAEEIRQNQAFVEYALE